MASVMRIIKFVSGHIETKVQVPVAWQHTSSFKNKEKRKRKLRTGTGEIIRNS